MQSDSSPPRFFAAFSTMSGASSPSPESRMVRLDFKRSRSHFRRSSGGRAQFTFRSPKWMTASGLHCSGRLKFFNRQRNQ